MHFFTASSEMLSFPAGSAVGRSGAKVSEMEGLGEADVLPARSETADTWSMVNFGLVSRISRSNAE